MKTLITSFLFTLFGLISTNSWAENTVTVENAWARATAPGQPNGAAYISLMNHSDKTVRLMSISSDTTISHQIEIHTHLQEDGMMKMRRLNNLSLPPHSQMTMQPGGHHLMLMKLQQPLKTGGTLPLTLRFDHHKPIQINASIQSQPPMSEHHHH
jgi:periplasmic copper chaperone A